jgi:hypothetical protein
VVCTSAVGVVDNSTFPWYKRANGGGTKSLILLVLRAVPDNPFLGTTPLKLLIAEMQTAQGAQPCRALVVGIAAVLLVAFRAAAENAVIA